MTSLLRARCALLSIVLLTITPIAAFGQELRQILPGILGNTVNTIIQQEIQRKYSQPQGSGGSMLYDLYCPGQWINRGSGHVCRCADGSLANMVGNQIVCPSAPAAGQPAEADRAARRSAPEAKPAAEAERARAREAWLAEQRAKDEARKVYESLKRRCLEKNERDACEQAYSYPDAQARDRERIAAQVNRMEQRARAEAEAQARLAAEQQRLAEEQIRAAEKAERQRLREELRQRILATGEQVIGAAMQPKTEPPVQTSASAGPASARVADQTLQAPIESAGPSAQQDGGPENAGIETRARLEREAEHLAGQGFKPTLAKAEGPVARDGDATTRVGLMEGVTYAFVAACVDCRHVQLALLSGDGVALGISPEEAEVVILAGPAPETAEYLIRLSVPGCAASHCHAGFRLLKQERAAPPAPPVAAGAPAVIPEPSPDRSAAASPRPLAPEPRSETAAAAPRSSAKAAKKAASAPETTAAAKTSASIQTAALQTAPAEEKAASGESKAVKSKRDAAAACAVLTSCAEARNTCIRDCRQRKHKSTGCSVGCVQSFELCRDTGEWSSRSCHRVGLAKN
jgi:hypothetical protein